MTPNIRSRSDLPEFQNGDHLKFIAKLTPYTFIEKAMGDLKDIPEEVLDDILERLQK